MLKALLHPASLWSVLTGAGLSLPECVGSDLLWLESISKLYPLGFSGKRFLPGKPSCDMIAYSSTVSTNSHTTDPGSQALFEGREVRVSASLAKIHIKRKLSQILHLNHVNLLGVSLRPMKRYFRYGHISRTWRFCVNHSYVLINNGGTQWK